MGILKNLQSQQTVATSGGSLLSRLKAKQPEKKGMKMVGIPGIDQLTNIGTGIGTSLAKGALSTAQLPFNIATRIGKTVGMDTRGTEGVVKGLEFVKKNVYSKPFEKNLETTSGKVGETIGNVLPYFAGSGAVTKATKALPLAQRIGLRTLGDIGISQAQTGGDVKTGLATGIPSLAGNLLFPGVGKTAGALSTIGKSTLVGYTGDVASGMAGFRGEDRTGTKAFIPGAGTAIGGALGVAMSTPQIKRSIVVSSEKRTIDKRFNALDKAQKSYSSLNKKIQASDRAGIDTKRFIAESNLLSDAVDKNGSINTKNAVSKMNDVLSPYESKVGDILKQENKSVSLLNLRLKLLETIDEAGLIGNVRTQAIKKMEGDLADLSRIADEKGNIPLYRVHDLKVQTNQLNAKSFIDPEANKVGKTIGRGLKEFVENSTDSIDVKTYNEELRKLYGIRDVLESLNGKKVQGGRLGKYFAQTVGAVAGSSVGGPVGAVVGAEAGGVLRGAQMSRAFGKASIGKTVEPTERMLGILNQSKNVGPLQINQTTNTAIPKNVISQTNAITNKNPDIKKSTSNLIDLSIPQNKKTGIPNKQGGFVRIMGKAFKEIPESTKKEMIQVMDYLNIGKKFPDAEKTLTRLMEKYNINPEWSNNKIADTFEKLIESTKTANY